MVGRGITRDYFKEKDNVPDQARARPTNWLPRPKVPGDLARRNGIQLRRPVKQVIPKPDPGIAFSSGTSELQQAPGERRRVDGNPGQPSTQTFIESVE